MPEPYTVILAGPNGAGKSTTAPALLRDTLAVEEFVNADVIARGLSAFAPDKAALRAGRIMLHRLDALAAKKVNFAFETTLAARAFVPWIHSMQTAGYKIHLLFLALPDEKMAMQRVAARVNLGGHNIPQPVIARRFHAGLFNLFQRYLPIVSSWEIYNNAVFRAPVLIAKGERNGKTDIINAEDFNRLRKTYANGQ
ncbi:zeta toxin family protein [Desulfosarcina sp. OttesenSCG-928-G10]|nr:zeta toxin family protein [Desulfosarcina sp. OttesenSCG-928-G10]MDL2321488.1 zeta toxin family protein [Desulfosarcina sp. OttesenSCG-928-B08]